MTFFTADEHYGHRNILRYCERPFATAREQDAELIRRHNMAVSADDTVYHLGDFTMRSKGDFPFLEKIMNRLNGIHHMILGSHDSFTPGQYLQAGFDSVHTSLHLELNGATYFLAHDPALFQFSPDPTMLCGHIHKWWKHHPTEKIINVGVDVWAFAPVSLDEIMIAPTERR